MNNEWEAGKCLTTFHWRTEAEASMRAPTSNRPVYMWGHLDSRQSRHLRALGEIPRQRVLEDVFFVAPLLNTVKYVTAAWKRSTTLNLWRSCQSNAVIWEQCFATAVVEKHMQRLPYDAFTWKDRKDILSHYFSLGNSVPTLHKQAGLAWPSPGQVAV